MSARVVPASAVACGHPTDPACPDSGADAALRLDDVVPAAVGGHADSADATDAPRQEHGQPTWGAASYDDAGEPAWGMSYGMDNVPSFDGDVTVRSSWDSADGSENANGTNGTDGAGRGCGTGSSDCVDGGPGWGAVRGDAAPTPPVGPFWDHLATVEAGMAAMLAVVHNNGVPASELAAATVALHDATSRLRAVHSAALGQTVAADALPTWAATAAAWVRYSHRLDGSRASSAVLNARWLADHALTRAAFEAGEIGFDHVTAIRAVADASDRRRQAYRMMEQRLLNAARQADPARTANFLKWWSDAVDATDGDDDADAAYAKRALYISAVGDGYDIRGFLPAAEGAELLGLLNAFAEKTRTTDHTPAHPSTDTTDTDGPTADTDAGPEADPGDETGQDAGGAGSAADAGAGTGAGDESGGVTDVPDDRTPAQRRADALIDALRAAAAADLTDGARHSAAVTVIVPIDRLTTDLPTDPDGTGHTPAPSHTTAPTGADHGCGATPAGPAGHGSAATPATPTGQGRGPAAGSFEPMPWLDRPEAHACSWAVGNGPGQGFLAMTEALRLTCDAQITRLVLDATSRPLDIGRTTRVIPPWIRRALDVRDGGCIICPPGERPPGWCEAHHIIHWAAGGETSAQNLVLLCSRHHHDLHKGNWHITITPTGHPTIHPGPTTAAGAGVGVGGPEPPGA